MEEKLDKLGRVIPQYDRSAVSKKAAETIKKERGDDFYSRIGAIGGSRRTRGYLGKLKDEGKTDELKELAKRAAVKSNQIQAEKRGKQGAKKGKGDESGV